MSAEQTERLRLFPATDGHCGPEYTVVARDVEAAECVLASDASRCRTALSAALARYRSTLEGA